MARRMNDIITKRYHNSGNVSRNGRAIRIFSTLHQSRSINAQVHSFFIRFSYIDIYCSLIVIKVVDNECRGEYRTRAFLIELFMQ